MAKRKRSKSRGGLVPDRKQYINRTAGCLINLCFLPFFQALSPFRPILGREQGIHANVTGPDRYA